MHRWKRAEETMREREALTMPLSTTPDPTNQTATPDQAPTVMHNAQELSVISNTRYARVQVAADINCYYSLFNQ